MQRGHSAGTAGRFNTYLYEALHESERELPAARPSSTVCQKPRCESAKLAPPSRHGTPRHNAPHDRAGVHGGQEVENKGQSLRRARARRSSATKPERSKSRGTSRQGRGRDRQEHDTKIQGRVEDRVAALDSESCSSVTHQNLPHTMHRDSLPCRPRPAGRKHTSTQMPCWIATSGDDAREQVPYRIGTDDNGAAPLRTWGTGGSDAGRHGPAKAGRTMHLLDFRTRLDDKLNKSSGSSRGDCSVVEPLSSAARSLALPHLHVGGVRPEFGQAPMWAHCEADPEDGFFEGEPAYAAGDVEDDVPTTVELEMGATVRIHLHANTPTHMHSSSSTNCKRVRKMMMMMCSKYKCAFRHAFARAACAMQTNASLCFGDPCAHASAPKTVLRSLWRRICAPHQRARALPATRPCAKRRDKSLWRAVHTHRHTHFP